MAQTCFIFKNGSPSTYLLAGYPSCLWARRLFLLPQLMSHRYTAGRIRRFRFVPQSHQVKYFSSMRDSNSRQRQNNESAAPFFLIQLSPWLFRLQELRRIRDGDDSDSETVSVHYATNGDLQWDDIKEGYTMQYIHAARASVVWRFQDLSTN